jgi:hypothetical protein
MIIIKNAVVLVLGMLSISADSFSQTIDSISKRTPDSIPKRAVAYAADKFAIARPLNIEFTQAAPYNYTAKSDGKSFPQSKVTSFSQVKVSANVNFIKRKTWMLGATLGYRYTATDADVINPATGGIHTINDGFHYHFTSLNVAYFSTLFKKRTIYTSSIMVDGSDQHFERVKGIITGTMVLKANQRTKLMVGFMVNIDPSAQSPFMPTFTYEHKFNNGIIADILLPRSIYFRKYMSASGRLSFGTEMDRTSFYLYDLDGTSQKYEYRQMDVNSGLVYEQVIAKYFMLTAKTGMKLTPSGRIFKKEDSFGSPVFETKPDPAIYFNIGLSFNPFTMIGKKK